MCEAGTFGGTFGARPAILCRRIRQARTGYEAGNVIASQTTGGGESLGGSWYDDYKGWKFDASGRMNRWEELGPWGGSQGTARGGESTFDGDGRPAKYAELTKPYTQSWTSVNFYHLYSSVTGQKITDIIASGAYYGHRVYMGDTVIHDDSTYQGPYVSAPDAYWATGFRVNDPISGSTQELNADGTIPTNTNARNEVGGLGTSIPSVAPTPYPGPNPYRGGDPGNAGFGCVLNGVFQEGLGPCMIALRNGSGEITPGTEPPPDFPYKIIPIPIYKYRDVPTPDVPDDPDGPIRVRTELEKYFAGFDVHVFGDPNTQAGGGLGDGSKLNKKALRQCLKIIYDLDLHEFKQPTKKTDGRFRASRKVRYYDGTLRVDKSINLRLNTRSYSSEELTETFVGDKAQSQLPPNWDVPDENVNNNYVVAKSFGADTTMYIPNNITPLATVNSLVIGLERQIDYNNVSPISTMGLYICLSELDGIK